MKTTQEILGGLACHAKSRRYMLECADCAYHTAECKSCTEDVHEDAMAKIVQLEAEVEQLAAIVKPFSPCAQCKHWTEEMDARCVSADYDCEVCPHAESCVCRTCSDEHSNWEWKASRSGNRDEKLGFWSEKRKFGCVYCCSECGYGVNVTHHYMYRKGCIARKDNRTPYCPNCGAKMDGAV